MSELSHLGAYRLIHQSQLTAAEHFALQRHLRECAACREHAAMAGHLRNNFVLQAPAARPSPRFTAVYLESAARRSRRTQVLKPVYAAAGMAALALIVLAGWFLVRSTPETTTLETVPIVKTLEVVVPAARPTETAVPPTGEATETAVPPTREATEMPADLAPTAVPPTPEPSATAEAEGRITHVNIPSSSLSDAIFGKDENDVMVYLPPSYDGSNRRYPAIYILPGEGALTPTEDYETMIALIAKIKLEAGEADEMIVVVPAWYNSVGSSTFFGNSPVNGDWQSFVARDLVGFIDANYRTLTAPASRGLFGEGGSGSAALNLAMNHPDIFSTLYLQHPWLLAPGGLAESNMASDAAQAAILDLVQEIQPLSNEEAFEELQRKLELGGNLIFADAETALSYSWDVAGDPELGPPFFEYLYVEKNIPAAEEVWAKWENGFGNIVEKVSGNQDNLRQLKAIAISEAENETAHPWATDGLRHLSEELTAGGIDHTMLSYEGTWANFAEPYGDLVLPFFSENLEFEE